MQNIANGAYTYWIKKSPTPRMSQSIVVMQPICHGTDETEYKYNGRNGCLHSHGTLPTTQHCRLIPSIQAFGAQTISANNECAVILHKNRFNYICVCKRAKTLVWQLSVWERRKKMNEKRRKKLDLISSQKMCCQATMRARFVLATASAHSN